VGKEKPAWLQEAREFCRSAGIEINAWGADTLVVKAESADRAKQVASQIRPLGFEPIEDEDDAGAGILLLSRNPAATRAKQTEATRTKQAESRAFADLTRMPIVERVAPVFHAALSIACFWYGTTQSAPTSWLFDFLASVTLIIFLWVGSRVWAWRLEMSAEVLQVRHRFRWTAIPWSQIRAVETKTTYARGAALVTVTLALASKPPLRLETFGDPFARALRDRLRSEITQRRREL